MATDDLDGLYQQVFQNDLLRELIVEKVVQTPAGSLSKEEAGRLRQVNRSWMATTNATFLKAGQPLFHITVGRDPMRSDCFNRAAFQNFLESFMDSGGSSPIPPFSLTIHPSAFLTDAVHLLYLFQLLLSYNGGPSLVQITIHPYILLSDDDEREEEEESIFFGRLPPNLEFPSVYKVTLEEGDWKDVRYQAFLQSILDRCPNLKEISLDEDSYLVVECRFPPLVTFLEISTAQLVQAVKNGQELPNLTVLKLYNSNNSTVEPAHAVQFFNRCRLTLREVHIDAFYPDKLVVPAIHGVSQYPRLTKLSLNPVLFFGEKSTSAWRPVEWSKQFPVLKTLDFSSCHHAVNLLLDRDKWCISNSLCLSLESLQLRLYKFVPEDQDDDYFDESDPVSLEDIETIGTTFPNLVHLEVELGRKDLEGLAHVFRELVNLQMLRVKVLDINSRTDCLSIVSILVGATYEMVAQLEEDPSLLPAFLEASKEHGPSIRNLKFLEKFSMDFSRRSSEGGYRLEGSLLMVLVHLAFLPLPRLRHLHFEGGIVVSPELEWLWRSQRPGGSVTVSRL